MISLAKEKEETLMRRPKKRPIQISQESSGIDGQVYVSKNSKIMPLHCNAVMYVCGAHMA